VSTTRPPEQPGKIKASQETLRQRGNNETIRRSPDLAPQPRMARGWVPCSGTPETTRIAGPTQPDRAQMGLDLGRGIRRAWPAPPAAKGEPHQPRPRHHHLQSVESSTRPTPPGRELWPILMEAAARVAFDLRCSLELALDCRLRHRPAPPPQGLRTTSAEAAPPCAPYNTMPKPARLPAQKPPSKGEGEPRRRPCLAFGRRRRPAAARRESARGGGLGRAAARVPPVARGRDAGLFFLCFSHSQSQRRKKKKVSRLGALDHLSVYKYKVLLRT
jgi:hypothetical protein